MPSGRPAAEVKPNKDGSVTIEYHPKERGIHELNLSYNEQPAEGTPFRCHVDALGSGFVTAYGQGLNFASSGQKAHFTVVGGGSDLSVNVRGPGKADVTKKEGRGSAVDIAYTPLSPGEYEIDVKVKNKHIHGSPFSTKVSGEGRKRSQVSAAATSEVTLGGHDVDLANMVGTLKLPNGNTEYCLLKKMPDGKLGVSAFTPKSKGTYKVEVVQDGKTFHGSPFTIQVGESQIASSAKVKTSGATKDGMAMQKNEIGIDISSAGYGSLACSIEGPHRSDLRLEAGEKLHYKLQYKPHEPGLYLMNLRFGDDHVQGSPFMISVGGEPSGRIRETIEKDITSAQATAPGSKCEFQLKIPGTDPLDMEAALTSPSAKTDLCEIRDLEESLYDIKFTPVEEGIHIVSLKHKGLHISGSPFQYTVGTPPAAGPYKVEIGGTGMEKGEVGIKNHFNIYTREAGGGRLSVAVEGPSKAKLEVVDRGNGFTTVSYQVTKEGEYGIHVKYDDKHVPDSPAMVFISPESAAARNVTIHGLRDRGLDVDKPATFTVNLNGGRGELKSHVDTPSGTEEDVYVQELDMDLHALRFLPRENGVYYVHIKLNEAHIPGSPFPMLIGKVGADPALVLAKGDGISKGESGKQSKFQVITTNAGAGTLNVNIQGPSKVAIMCQEIDEGYEFTYTPMAPGEYLINIKYCNVTIAGCPAMAIVTGSGEDMRQSKGKASDIRESSGIVVETVEKKAGAVVKKRFVGDASKIQAKGNGLKKGFMNRPATFDLDVKDAGQGLLLIGMITPGGNPVTELSFKKTRATIYQISYRAPERGDHQLTVRWGTDDIPGSPFTITVT